jgi:RNA polymerase sigma factor (sigma-70 family)
MHNPTSQELLSRFRRGDQHAADEIFDRYVERLLQVARRRLSPKLTRRIDAEDVVQSAYRSFFLHARDGDYQLQRAGDLWRLLVAITLNKLYGQVEVHTAQRRDVNREDAVGAATQNDNPSVAASTEPTPDEVAEVSEQLRLILEQITPQERTVLELRLTGQTIEDIANEVGRSQRTVRRLLENTRIRLEQVLLQQ